MNDSRAKMSNDTSFTKSTSENDCYVCTENEPTDSLINLTQDERNEIKEAFTLYDTDDDGLIATTDVGTVLRSLGWSLTVCEETDIIAQFALDNCYEIDYDGFLNLVSKRKTEVDDNEMLTEALKTFDKEETGYIRRDLLRKMLLTEGEPLTEKEVDDWLREGEKYITDEYLFYEKFASAMLSK